MDFRWALEATPSKGNVVSGEEKKKKGVSKMTSCYLELNNEIKIRLDLDADNTIDFFDLTLPRRTLEEDDFRRMNKAIENLKN